MNSQFTQETDYYWKKLPQNNSATLCWFGVQNKLRILSLFIFFFFQVDKNIKFSTI